MKDRLNALTETIIGAAIEVHHALGPGQVLDVGYRIDVLVEGLVVVEVKAVECLDRVHTAQLLSYLKLSGCKVGLLLNFNVKWLVENGIKRIVNGFPD